MSSKSNAIEPSVPLTSSRRAFLRPVANRVASKTPMAPSAKRPVKAAASSTVTGPRSASAVEVPPSVALSPAIGRVLTNVSISPLTEVIDEPVTNCAMSMM